MSHAFASRPCLALSWQIQIQTTCQGPASTALFCESPEQEPISSPWIPRRPCWHLSVGLSPLGPTRLWALGKQGVSHSSLRPQSGQWVPNASVMKEEGSMLRTIFKRRIRIRNVWNANSRLCSFFLLKKTIIRCLISRRLYNRVPEESWKSLLKKRVQGSGGWGVECL